MNSVHWPEVSPLLRRMLSGQEVTTHADLRLLERHRREIERALTDLCGYRLRIDRHAARLIKIPPKGPMCRPLRVKRNGERVAFDVRRFAVLWATLAALSDGADRGRLQWKLADLVDVIVVEAADAGVSLDMTVADDRRRVVRDVLTCLHDELHILALQDGEPDALRSEEWRERPALYGVDEEALDRLLGVTAQYDSIDDAYRASRRAVEDDREERLAARRALFTEMLEAPVVYTAALDSLQSDVLRRAGREHIVGREDATSVSLSDLFGMQPEYRLEGISLLDPSGESTDSADRFPARSRERQCALLLAAHLTRTDPLGRAAQRKALADLIRDFAKTWSVDANDPRQIAELTQSASGVLVANRLAAQDPDGTLHALPAVNRFAGLTLTTSAAAADGGRIESTIPLFQPS